MRRFLLTALVTSLVAAACSEGSDGVQVASLSDVEVVDSQDTGDEIDREEALFAFTECLREQGIEVDDPEMGPEGELRPPRPSSMGEDDREAMLAAREACAVHLEGVTLGFEDRDTIEFQDMLLEYAACMRDNGWDMPDPDLSGFQPGSGQGPGRAVFGNLEDRDDPAFIAADEECRSIFGDSGFLPGRGGGPGGGGPGGG